MAAGENVIEPAAFVPRQADAAFVVGIERDRLAVGSEIEVVRIAKAVGDEFGRAEVRREAENEAADG